MGMANIVGLCSGENYQLASIQEQHVKSKLENSNLSVFLEIKPSFAILSTLTFFIVSPIRVTMPATVRWFA